MLNTYYKILARLVVIRIRTSVPDITHPGQHCGVSDRNIFDAAAGIQDAVACAELTGQPLCLLSLDFWAAFTTYLSPMYYGRRDTTIRSSE